MNKVPGPESTGSQPPREGFRDAFADLFPGLLQDGVLDAKRLGELLDVDVAGLMEGKERFGLMWAGRQKAVEALQAPSYAALVPDVENSVNWDAAENVFIEGDNLEVLKLLQKAYNDQVKLIYIDPPYNTGNDFVYNDDFSDPTRHYLEVTGQVDAEGNRLVANTEVSGRKHSNWLTMMHPRLTLARNLLTQDGVICVSIDDNEVSNLTHLLNEVFGPENHLATMIWNKQHSQQQGLFKKYHEYVVVFARDASKLGNIEGGEGLIEAGALKKVSAKNGASNFEFPAGVRFDAPDGTELSGTFGDSEKVEVVEGRLVAEGGKTKFPVTLRAGWTQKNQMRSWFDGAETIDTKGQRVLEFFFNAAGKLKSIKERSSITPPTILPEYGMVSEQTAKLDALMGAHLFDNPKPVELVKDFARWFTSGRDIVLDFFAGSGTTAQSVLELNAEDGASRRFVLVNIAEATNSNSEARKLGYETVSEITLERLKKIQALDRRVGFKAFRLSASAFGAPEVIDDNQLALRTFSRTTERSLMDSAWEVFVSLGVTLDTAVTLTEDKGQSVLVAGNTAVAISVVPSFTMLDIAERAGAKILAAFEDTFAGKDDLKANLYFACKKANVTFRTF